MRKEDAAWLAAAIDGEGSIMFYHRTYKSGTVGNPSEERTTLDMCASFFEGGGGIYARKNKKSKKIVYYFSITNQQIIKNVLTSIIPYLIIKKENAKKILKFYEGKINKIELKHSDKSNNRTLNNYKKGWRGDSESHRKAALKGIKNYKKGWRGESHRHKQISLNRK